MNVATGEKARRAASDIVALAALGALALQLLYLCGGPLRTADLWWHLKMGEVYVTQGLWPKGDPLLHTAYPYAPIQHEWLFDVAVHGIARAFGLNGLRVAHVLAVVGILVLAWSLLRRESAGAAAAAAAACVFTALAWPRLMQLRPDLVSIPATFLLYRWLLLTRGPPGWSRIALCVVLLLVWVNAHSLFAVGLLLSLAGLVGIGLRAALVARAVRRGADLGVDPALEAARLRRVGAGLGLGLAITFLNPRGFWQHLTFFTSSREAAIWRIADEWAPFHPFSPPLAESVGWLAWLLADAVLALFLVVAVWHSLRFLRRPTATRLALADPVLLAVALASASAALLSVRFLWLLAFPLLHLLRAARLSLRPSVASAGRWLFAVAAVALAVAAPQAEFNRKRVDRLPASLGAYLRTAYDAAKFHDDTVRFLEETGIEGNLYNSYGMGGFLGYRLAPRLRTFIDGRTEHYPPEVYRDYKDIAAMRGSRSGESFLDVLDRRGVNVFFGDGVPGERPYTSAHLERAEGWLLVWRSQDDAIYLRHDARNAENLARIAAWYRREGVPFDPRHGLDVAAVLRARPDWAVAHRWVPRSYPLALAERDSKDPGRRARALATLGLASARIGAYEEGIEAERELIRLRPDAKATRRRLVYDLLRLGRQPEGLVEAQALAALDPADARSARTLKVARLYGRRRAAGAKGAPPEALLGSIELRAP